MSQEWLKLVFNYPQLGFISHVTILNFAPHNIFDKGADMSNLVFRLIMVSTNVCTRWLTIMTAWLFLPRIRISVSVIHCHSN